MDRKRDFQKKKKGAPQKKHNLKRGKRMTGLFFGGGKSAPRCRWKVKIWTKPLQGGVDERG